MNNPVIIFDGVCNLCNGIVRLLIRIDKRKIFKFAASQSVFIQMKLKDLKFTNEEVHSILFLDSGKILIKSDAALEIVKYLPYYFRPLLIMKILPKSIRDYLYDLIARNRYKIFGMRENCIIPDADVTDRFIIEN